MGPINPLWAVKFRGNLSVKNVQHSAKTQVWKTPSWHLKSPCLQMRDVELQTLMEGQRWFAGKPPPMDPTHFCSFGFKKWTIHAWPRVSSVFFVWDTNWHMEGKYWLQLSVHVRRPSVFPHFQGNGGWKTLHLKPVMLTICSCTDKSLVCSMRWSLFTRTIFASPSRKRVAVLELPWRSFSRHPSSYPTTHCFKNDRALINLSRWLIEMMYDSHLFSLIPQLLELCNCMIN